MILSKMLSRMRKKSIETVFRNVDAMIPENIKNSDVLGIHYDSRKIKKGDLFVAIKGYKTDGHRYLESVNSSGAVAAVVEDVNTDIDLPQIVTKNSRKIMAQASANFFAPEIDQMRLLGITGTNGKTTTSFLIRSILEHANVSSGLIGTIAYYIGNESKNAWNTTPESVDICEMLYEMYNHGQKACVLEVSSHALTLERVSGLKFETAVFTNLSRDHLDFHKDEDDYFQAKAKLFTLLQPNANAIVNTDDPFGRRLKDMIKDPVLSFGFDAAADIYPVDWQMEMTGTHIKLMTPVGELKINTKLIGEFNIQNIMAAVGVGVALELPLSETKTGIEALEYVPGRLQSVDILPETKAFIDYSHTPDSLEKAIKTLRQVVKKRLIVVFGCGGDRDKGKRPIMGKIAETFSDFAIVTTDNPRTEDPKAIIDDILSGMKESEKKKVIVDRREAIFEAVKMSEDGDIILIAGKGHESYQEINGVKYDFNEVGIVQEAAAHV